MADKGIETQMNIQASGLEGLRRAEARLEEAGRRLAKPASLAEPSQADSVSLSENAVQILEAVNTYEANLRLIATGNEIDKKTLDLLG